MEERLRALLRLAIRCRASDIHFIRRHYEVQIEMRINAKMQAVKSTEKDLRLLSYLQYLSGMDIGDILKPQTGQFEYELDGQLLALRYAVIANPIFTSGVLRILNKQLSLNPYHLSLMESQNAILHKAIGQDSGLILFAGSTGSGKTTTLYHILKGVKGRKIYTLEDPIEVYNEEFVQIPINEAIGFNYAEGIKQIMRHDPDIIMIGEIRDEDAAKMAIRAANTGHLVLSSIHAGSAEGSINRLTELGVLLPQLKDVLVLLSYQKMIFLKGSQKRTVLYEMMDEAELHYFFERHEHSPHYINVHEQLKALKAKGLADEEL